MPKKSISVEDIVQAAIETAYKVWQDLSSNGPEPWEWADDAPFVVQQIASNSENLLRDAGVKIEPSEFGSNTFVYDYEEHLQDW